MGRGQCCIDAHGGYGYAEEYDVERKFREACLQRRRPSTTTRLMAGGHGNQTTTLLDATLWEQVQREANRGA